MKKLFLATVITTVLFFIGCQENSLVDPVSPEYINKDIATSGNIVTGTIQLDGLLVLQGGFQTYFTIEGQIDYTHETVFLDPIPPAPQFYIDLDMSIRATLSDGASKKLSISTESNNEVYVGDDGAYFMEKVFPLNGSNYQLSLICKFIVTSNGLGLSEMILVEGYVNLGSGVLNKNIQNVEIKTFPPVPATKHN